MFMFCFFLHVDQVRDFRGERRETRTKEKSVTCLDDGRYHNSQEPFNPKRYLFISPAHNSTNKIREHYKTFQNKNANWGYHLGKTTVDQTWNEKNLLILIQMSSWGVAWPFPKLKSLTWFSYFATCFMIMVFSDGQNPPFKKFLFNLISVLKLSFLSMPKVYANLLSR